MTLNVEAFVVVVSFVAAAFGSELVCDPRSRLGHEQKLTGLTEIAMDGSDSGVLPPMTKSGRFCRFILTFLYKRIS